MNSPATIVLASEFGSNLGHLGRDLALARAYRAKGLHVVLLVPDLRATRGFLGLEHVTVLQAPILRQGPRPRRSSRNFADMVLNLGFGDELALGAAVDAWLGLFETLRPALVVYNNAPTALLAARIAGLPVKLVGSAFEIPPATQGLPSFESPEGTTDDFAAACEAELVARMNRQAARFDQPGRAHLRDWYFADGERACIATLPELDPFGPRDEVQYVGPVFELHDGASLTSPEAASNEPGAPRGHIFAYMLPSARGLEALLECLNASTHEVICVIPGLPDEYVARFTKIRFSRVPGHLAYILPDTQLVITSGVSLLATALLAGVPVLYAPQTIEQHLVARAAARIPTVTVCPLSGEPAPWVELVDGLVNDPALKASAVSLAEQQFGYAFENNARRVTRDTERQQAIA